MTAVYCGTSTEPSLAEVAVFSNRTRELLTLSVRADGTNPTHLSLEVGQSRPVFYQRALRVSFQEGLVERSHQVKPKSAYFFTRGPRSEGPLRMEQIGFGDNAPAPSPAMSKKIGQQEQSTTIPVKILVDDDEPTHRQLWETKLRNRVARASEILELHSGVKLKVVAVGTWDSDDRQHDFSLTLREFEKEVVPKPARLAIGFSSQYKVSSGRRHMGGTRGALYPYILLKERSPTILESERLVLLLHELGHYLGASHSPEPQSVMRPLLTSGLQRQAGSQIQFDPVNTLLMAMVGDEIRNRGVRRLSQVSPPTKRRMQEIYTVLSKALPDDPAASQYLQLLGVSNLKPELQQKIQQVDRSTVRDLRRLLLRLVRHVRARQPDLEQNPDAKWYTGDDLTEFYVRQAALVALQIEPEEMEKVFLMSLGVFMESSDVLRKFPATQGLVSNVENEAEREARLSILGQPTMHGRPDLAQHFFVSAHLTASLGPRLALSVGLGKEMMDANGGSGFSFADMAANRAGIEFALRIAAGEISLAQLTERFEVSNYLPPIDGLTEGLQVEDLRARYGETSSEPFKSKLVEIERRVLSLPVYNRSRAADN